MQHVCTITSVPVTKTFGKLDVEQGVWECVVEIDTATLTQSSSPQSAVDLLIAQSIARCRQESGLPLGEYLWKVEFSYWAQRSFNFPEGFVI